MNTYDYRGYIITEDENGYFLLEDPSLGTAYEFISYDDVCDWIDELLDSNSIREDLPQNHLYFISYVTSTYNKSYNEYIYAPSKEDAIAELKRTHNDIAYISDIYED